MAAGVVDERAVGVRERGSGRIVGIDLARCLAIVGMLAAHVGHDATGDEDGGWVMPFDGRSAALFATLAGVSLAIITRRSDERPLGWRYARFAIAVRGALLLLLGFALVLLDTPIEIILASYGLMFLLVLPVLRLPVRALLALAGAVVVLSPVVVFWLQDRWVGEIYPDTELAAYDPLLTGTYPALIWMGYLLTGLVVGRTLIRPAWGAWVLVGVGVVLAPLGYASGHLLASTSGARTDEWPGVLLSVEPHADTGFEVVGNLGVACVVIGLCLLVTRTRFARALLAPLLAAGSMSLTIYTAQILLIKALGDDVVLEPTSNRPFLALTIGSILAAWAWRATFGQGPMERVVGRSSALVARVSVGDPRGGAGLVVSGHDDGDPDARREP